MNVLVAGGKIDLYLLPTEFAVRRFLEVAGEGESGGANAIESTMEKGKAEGRSLTG